MVIFFANPPVSHPFIIEPFHKLTNKYNYKLKIVDTGVYAELAKTGEIPKKTIEGMSKMVGKKKNVLITCPDYPPLSFEFGLKVDYDNVERTKKMMDVFPKHETNLYVFQLRSKTLERLSYKEIKETINEFNPPYSNYLGIGGICRLFKTKKEWLFSRKVAKQLRREFPDSFIHGFGFGLKQLAYCRDYIDSFDNSKWTRPCKQTKDPLTGKNLGACKTNNQRIEFFRMYLKRIDEIINHTKENNQTTITEFME